MMLKKDINKRNINIKISQTLLEFNFSKAATSGAELVILFEINFHIIIIFKSYLLFKIFYLIFSTIF